MRRASVPASSYPLILARSADAGSRGMLDRLLLLIELVLAGGVLIEGGRPLGDLALLQLFRRVLPPLSVLLVLVAWSCGRHDIPPESRWPAETVPGHGRSYLSLGRRKRLVKALGAFTRPGMSL